MVQALCQAQGADSHVGLEEGTRTARGGAAQGCLTPDSETRTCWKWFLHLQAEIWMCTKGDLRGLRSPFSKFPFGKRYLKGI